MVALSSCFFQSFPSAVCVDDLRENLFLVQQPTRVADRKHTDHRRGHRWDCNGSSHGMNRVDLDQTTYSGPRITSRTTKWQIRKLFSGRRFFAFIHVV